MFLDKRLLQMGYYDILDGKFSYFMKFTQTFFFEVTFPWNNDSQWDDELNQMFWKKVIKKLTNFSEKVSECP